MATLAESFLEDLEDLDSQDEVEQGETNDKSRDLDLTPEILDAVELYLSYMRNGEDGSNISELAAQKDFIDLIERVKELQVSNSSQNLSMTDEYDLIEKCNQYVITLDTEIMNIHKFLKDLYSKKFPELESIVYSPLDYVNVVRRIQNENDLTRVDLSDLLHNTVIMAVTVAASMTAGTALPPNELNKLTKACDEALHLAECRKEILSFLESRMKFLAPNLSAILGSPLAARLLSHAGGLASLAKMPAQNIMLIGNSKRSSTGTGAVNNLGIIWMSELIQGVPSTSRNRAVKYVCGKSSLAARVDWFKQSPTGEIGIKMREDIIAALIAHQQPPPPPSKKILPAPDEKRGPKRGGKRHRRAKEKYGLTDLRKLANRSKFGPEPEEEIGLHIGKTTGMLGMHTGLGRVKLQAKQTKSQLPNKRVKQLAKTSNHIDGTISSLAFTPLQGIEFFNPDVAQPKTGQTNERYFSATASFAKS